MRHRLTTLVLLASLGLGACSGPGAGMRTRETEPADGSTYSNPVLDDNFPDPTVIRASDGWHYAYATQGEREGPDVNIQVARSRDLVRWEQLADALPVKPSWASKTQDFWAPHVSEHEGRFYLYFSAKPDAALSDTTRGLCLAVATAAGAAGPFTDVGQPLQCGPGFVNIDPMAFDDPRTGRRWLYWGSGFGPIKVRELASDRVSFATGSEEIPLLPTVQTQDSTDYRRLVEGAWVTYRAPWYYLFFSGDNCCGPRAHYAVMIARAPSATGPFELAGGSREGEAGVILERDNRWVAPGHNSIIRDARGDEWMAYHAVDALRPRARSSDAVNTRRVMLLDRIVYVDGWPRIDGAPSSAPRPAPAVP